MAPIGVALIGGGIFAKGNHLPAILKCDLLSLRVIYSRSLKSAKEAAGVASEISASVNPDLYADDAGAGKTFDDVLGRQDVQAVIIALPIPNQPAHVKAALSAGKHVFAEKPISADVESARELIEYYRSTTSSNGATYAVAENGRFYPMVTFAKKHIANFGRVTHFSVRVMNFMAQEHRYYGTSWRRDPKFQGGFLLDSGVHHAAVTRQLLHGDTDKMATVLASTNQVQEHLLPFDTVSAIMRTESGATGTYQHSAGSRCLQAYNWDVGYEKGSITIAGDAVTVTNSDGEKAVGNFPRSFAVMEEMAAWAQSLADGKPNPLQSPEEALADLEFLEKMFRSGSQGGTPQRYEYQ